MPTLPWRSFARSATEQPCVALLTYLPLNRVGHIPQFLLHTMRIRAQLKKSRGLIGYSLRAELTAKRFWTLSVWQDEASLRDFAYAQPHAGTMTALTPHMGATRFIRWTVAGRELPLRWEDALKRWRAD